MRVGIGGFHLEPVDTNFRFFPYLLGHVGRRWGAAPKSIENKVSKSRASGLNMRVPHFE